MPKCSVHSGRGRAPGDCQACAALTGRTTPEQAASSFKGHVVRVEAGLGDADRGQLDGLRRLYSRAELDALKAGDDEAYKAAQAAGFPCRCGRSWGGLRRSHCGACHHTFSSLTAFDKHRSGFLCRVPHTIGLVEREGVWGMPGERPELGDDETE